MNDNNKNPFENVNLNSKNKLFGSFNINNDENKNITYTIDKTW